jgi:hypothetical protein
MTTQNVSEQGLAAMAEFGFENVDFGVEGSPAPTLIALKLGDIARDLDDALRLDFKPAAVEALAQLRRLQNALDAWVFSRMLDE